MLPYFVSLLIANVLQAAGTSMNVKWVLDRAVQEGTFCTLQGATKQAGNVGMALWSGFCHKPCVFVADLFHILQVLCARRPHIQFAILAMEMHTSGTPYHSSRWLAFYSPCGVYRTIGCPEAKPWPLLWSLRILVCLLMSIHYMKLSVSQVLDYGRIPQGTDLLGVLLRMSSIYPLVSLSN